MERELDVNVVKVLGCLTRSDPGMLVYIDSISLIPLRLSAESPGNLRVSNPASVRHSPTAVFLDIVIGYEIHGANHMMSRQGTAVITLLGCNTLPQDV